RNAGAERVFLRRYFRERPGDRRYGGQAAEFLHLGEGQGRESADQRGGYAGIVRFLPRIGGAERQPEERDLHQGERTDRGKAAAGGFAGCDSGYAGSGAAQPERDTGPAEG